MWCWIIIGSTNGFENVDVEYALTFDYGFVFIGRNNITDLNRVNMTEEQWDITVHIVKMDDLTKLL